MHSSRGVREMIYRMLWVMFSWVLTFQRFFDDAEVLMDALIPLELKRNGRISLGSSPDALRTLSWEVSLVFSMLMAYPLRLFHRYSFLRAGMTRFERLACRARIYRSLMLLVGSIRVCQFVLVPWRWSSMLVQGEWLGDWSRLPDIVECVHGWLHGFGRRVLLSHGPRLLDRVRWVMDLDKIHSWGRKLAARVCRSFGFFGLGVDQREDAMVIFVVLMLCWEVGLVRLLLSRSLKGLGSSGC